MTTQTAATQKITGRALDRLLQMPLAPDKVELAFAAAKAAYSSVQTADGTEVAVAQPAYLGEVLEYKARGIDAAGNGYRITWPVKPAIAALTPEQMPEDESEMCDWSRPSEVVLVERA